MTTPCTVGFDNQDFSFILQSYQNWRNTNRSIYTISRSSNGFELPHNEPNHSEQQSQAALEPLHYLRS